MRILLIEDDSMVGRALKAGMRQDGHAADWVSTASAAHAAWLAPSSDLVPYDAVIVDLGLPDGSGVDLIRKARARGTKAVILIVTSRGRIADRIAGLDAGADDYMVKPIDLDELAARLRAIERRATGRGGDKFVFGTLTIDAQAQTVSLRGEPVELTAQEFALLLALARRPGAIVSRAKLEEALYNWDNEVGSNIIEVQIHRLRHKLGAKTIVTHRGLGYRLVEPELS
ncbi:MAG: winged helix-turn-helix domain-containing protein [Steroidobacteraceae bacterium]